MGRREKSDGRRTSMFSTGSARGEGERSLNGKSLNILDTYGVKLYLRTDEIR